MGPGKINAFWITVSKRLKSVSGNIRWKINAAYKSTALIYFHFLPYPHFLFYLQAASRLVFSAAMMREYKVQAPPPLLFLCRTKGSENVLFVKCFWNIFIKFCFSKFTDL